MKTRRIYLSAATLMAVAALLTYNLPLSRVEEPKTQLMLVRCRELTSLTTWINGKRAQVRTTSATTRPTPHFRSISREDALTRG